MGLPGATRAALARIDLPEQSGNLAENAQPSAQAPR